MSKDNDINKDSAFAAMTKDNFGYVTIQPGLTKREYMATKILAGFLKNDHNHPESLVEYVLEITDELIEKLNQNK